MRTNLLLGTAAVGVLITGAVAQTSSGIERIKDAAGYSKSLSSGGEKKPGTQTPQNDASAEPSAQVKKTVRTVYPNTQNAEQAAQQSKTAQAAADASKRQPGDVTPLSTTPAPATQANTQPSPSAPVTQPSAQTPSTAQGTAASSASATSSTQPSAPAPSAHPAQPAAPATTAQSAQSTPSTQVTTAPAPTTQPSTSPATAEQSPARSEPVRQSSNGVVALDTQQQTSIGHAIAAHNVKPLTNVTFSMAIGTKVPSSVQLRALPSDVAAFVPQYRGYSYFVVEEQMVIVDPGTQAIVAIVPYTASTVASHPVESTPAAHTATRAAEPAPATHTAAEKRTTKSHEASTRKHPQKPMVTRAVNLNTEEKSTRQPSTERKATRTVSKRDDRDRAPAVREYRESERAAPTVTIEDDPQPVYREILPRRRGFFGFFGGSDDDDD